MAPPAFSPEQESYLDAFKAEVNATINSKFDEILRWLGGQTASSVLPSIKASPSAQPSAQPSAPPALLELPLLLAPPAPPPAPKQTPAYPPAPSVEALEEVEHI